MDTDGREKHDLYPFPPARECINAYDNRRSRAFDLENTLRLNFKQGIIREKMHLGNATVKA